MTKDDIDRAYSSFGTVLEDNEFSFMIILGFIQNSGHICNVYTISVSKQYVLEFVDLNCVFPLWLKAVCIRQSEECIHI